MSLAGGRRAVSIAMVCGLLLACASQRAFSGSGSIISLPAGGPSPTVAGLTLVLDCQWADGRGYRPFIVGVTCSPAATADRSLEIELGASLWPNRKFATVSFDLEIPAGSSAVTKVVSVPQFSAMQFLSVDVWEDGVHLDRLSQENAAVGSAAGWGWGQGGEVPSVLFVTKKNLDLTQLSFLSTNASYNPRGVNENAFTSAAQVASFVERTPDELVENWINYSGLDVVFLSLADVEYLVAKRPRVMQALCEWTWSGGNLCVQGVGSDWHGLATLEELLHIGASAEEADLPARGWQQPNRTLYAKQWTGEDGITVYGDPDDAPADDAESAAGDNPDDSADGGNNQKSKKKTSKKRTAKKREPPKKDPFVWKPAMLGRVVAIGQADPFPGEKADWQWVFNTISPARWKWRLRQGLSLDSENPAFYNFLIADVGLPPIRTYRVLISLFVIVIGPLNYWFLRRHGRLHLLLFTVPAAALLASGSLIGYVIVADGFESRIRARSFTQLDQRHHEAVSWSRLSYYTGLSPSGGLLFPDDTVILPLEKSPRWDSLGARTRHMAWPSDGNEQRLARGWLASRTPTQYVAIRAAETERELTIRPSDDGQNCAVKNRLGTKIKRLLVCDAAGKLHVGADIDPLAQADLRLLEVGDGTRNALIEFREALTHDVPRMPEPGESELANSGFFPSMRRARFGWQNMGNDHDTARSVLESEIDRIGAACLTEKFAPRTYVAIVERPDDVPVGIESLIETQSLHVISGTW